MKKYLALLLVGPLLVAGCSTDPVSVVEQFQNAVNSQDVEAAIELLAEDSVLQVGETLSRTGKAEIENWLETQAELNHRIEGEPTAAEFGVVIESCSISSDMWIYFGVNPMSGTCEVALEGGLITRFAVQFDENSKGRLSESMVPVTGDLVGIWTSADSTPQEPNKYIPFFLQFFEDGIARSAVSPEDFLIAPDSNHPGVRYTWTYKDYVLTVQNQGPASEGYCQEQDVGTYLVRNTEEGGIQFRPLKDPCAWRTHHLNRVGGDWDLYVP